MFSVEYDNIPLAQAAARVFRVDRDLPSMPPIMDARCVFLDKQKLYTSMDAKTVRQARLPLGRGSRSARIVRLGIMLVLGSHNVLDAQ